MAPVEETPPPSRLRATARLLCDAAAGVTDVVEQMHGTVQELPFPVGARSAQRSHGLTGFVYGRVRGTIRLAREIMDSTLSHLPASPRSADAAKHAPTSQAVLNGVFGDYLAHTSNALALPMTLRCADGQEIDPCHPAVALAETPNRSAARPLLMIHGLCMSDAGWQREGHHHGLAIAQDLAYQPLYLRYNSGLSVATNGAQLARLLETLLAHWPTDIEELAVLAYSMGGLVARSAVHQARQAGMRWPQHLKRIVFLGTPHHGTALERAGACLDLAVQVSAYSRPLAQVTTARSAGITDLRYGRVCEEQRDVPLPEGVSCCAIAAVSKAGSDVRLESDGLVSLDSALGRHRDPARDLAIPPTRQWAAYGVGHLDLLSHPSVYAQLRAWLGARHVEAPPLRSS